jgi:MOSC domain-containing protein YiiM
LITAEGVDELAAQGFPLHYGALAENITTRGVDRRSLRIGERFRAGEAVIELTEVRFPCNTLNVYGAGIQAAWDPASPVWRMSGFYASVVEPGTLRPGDATATLQKS